MEREVYGAVMVMVFIIFICRNVKKLKAIQQKEGE